MIVEDLTDWFSCWVLIFAIEEDLSDLFFLFSSFREDAIN